jgi:hypothetical protein
MAGHAVSGHLHRSEDVPSLIRLRLTLASRADAGTMDGFLPFFQCATR